MHKTKILNTGFFGIVSKFGALALIAFALFQSSFVSAASGPPSALSFSLNKSSAPADGSSSITVTVKSFWYLCNQGSQSNSVEECDYLTPPGYSGNTKVAGAEDVKTSVDSGAAISTTALTTNGSGNGTFTVSSSTAGTYNVYAKSSSGFVRAQKSVTFTHFALNP